jgi:transposase
MIKIAFSEQDIQQIKYLRDRHPHPRVRQRMDALWLKSQGLAHKEICRIVGISNTTLCKYLRMFLHGGVEKLKELNFCVPTSELEEHRHRLEVYFREHPPASIKEAMAKIEELTGIKRSAGAIGRFLRSLGMSPRKVGAVPSKADPQEQEEWKNKELDPRLEEAKEGKRVVFFVDAAHFVLASFLGILWSFSRLFVKAPAGRPFDWCQLVPKMLPQHLVVVVLRPGLAPSAGLETCRPNCAGRKSGGCPFNRTP